VPRVWDMIHQEVQSRSTVAPTSPRAGAGQKRLSLMGGRYVSAMTGSAPMAAELKAWVERFLDMHLVEGYGSTRGGRVFVDGQIRRPPVDRLQAGRTFPNWVTSVPISRIRAVLELLVKSQQLFPRLLQAADVSAEGVRLRRLLPPPVTSSPRSGPTSVRYVDRRNNVLKLSQGEFVHRLQPGGRVHREPAGAADLPVRQQFPALPVGRGSCRPPGRSQMVTVPNSSPRIAESLSGRRPPTAGLRSYEIPRDFPRRDHTVHLENGLLTGIRKAGVATAQGALTVRHWNSFTPTWLEGQADELKAIRQSGADAPTLPTILRAAAALLGAPAGDVSADTHFTDLGGELPVRV